MRRAGPLRAATRQLGFTDMQGQVALVELAFLLLLRPPEPSTCAASWPKRSRGSGSAVRAQRTKRRRHTEAT
jgi:hypothetical protein